MALAICVLNREYATLTLSIELMEIHEDHWWIQGVPPACAPPTANRTQFFHFHMFPPTIVRIGA